MISAKSLFGTTITLLAAMEGYGFNGMSVAFIAGCAPIGCIPASIMFAALIYGGMSVQQALGVPSDIINITIGTIVFFTALPGIAPYFADKIKQRREAKELANGTKAGEA